MSKRNPFTQCAAHGCAALKPGNLLMCQRHWRMVCTINRQMVHITNGEWSDGKSTAQPWLIAREMARLDVAEHEGKPLAVIVSIKAEIERLSNFKLEEA